MSTVLLDTHVLHWWSAEPDRLSATARKAVVGADEIAVAAISWFELAWLAENERIVLSVPTRSWLQGLSDAVRTIPLTAAIGGVAAALPSSFPGDPADRLIYASAIETGVRLVTKDRRLRDHPQPRQMTIW